MILTGVSLLLSLLGGNGTSNSVVPTINNNFNFLGGGNNNGAGVIPTTTTTTTSSVNLQLNENPYRHRLTLDPRGNYRLEWEVDWEDETVYFNVTVVTKGYVGFGLSKKGKMSGSDIVIGGVDINDNTYFSDRHAVNNQQPIIDRSQDWTLHEAWERGGLTFLSFFRPFVTCDSEGDLPIDGNLLSVIWAYSDKYDDDHQFHFKNRGAHDIYLLDPNLAPESLTDRFQRGGATKPSSLSSSFTPAPGFGTNLNVFQIREQRSIPKQQDTLYWCSFHRVPTTTKHHVIGFNTDFPTDLDRRSVHHLLLYRCQALPGSTAALTLSQASTSGGGECYLGNNFGPPATSFCREEIYVWGVNGRANFFPKHVGVPVSESGTEYLMLQVHYDNSNLLPSLTVTLTLDLYYTSTLRQNDAGIILVGSSIPSTTNLVIPPSSPNHVINGHCASRCTERMLPKEGVRVFAVLGHTHITGRGVKLRHFREGKELAWLGADENYNFDYQQIRLLRDERIILPGDQLVQSCVHDTTQRNGTVVTGGYSTSREMCLMHLYYYTRVPGITNCLSEIREESYRNLLGIQNTTFDSNRREVVITNPTKFAGLTVSDYLTNHVEWHHRLRKEVQNQHFFQPQISTCPTPSSSSSTNPLPSLNGDVRDKFIRQKKQKPTGYLDDNDIDNSLMGPGPPYDFVGSRPPRKVPGKSDNFPAKLHYNFNLRKRRKSSTNRIGFPASRGIISSQRIQNQDQNFVVNEEDSRLPRGIAKYKPDSKPKCKLGYEVGREKGGGTDKVIDFKDYPDYIDENKIFESNRIIYENES